MKTNPTHTTQQITMRVLLGAALVAGASANQTKWQAFYAADQTANKPDIPTTVTDAVNTTYDEAMQAFGKVVGEQMDKAADARDYDKVVAAAATLEAACGVYVASYGADSTFPEIGADAAAKTAAKAAAKIANANAFKSMADEYIGKCTFDQDAQGVAKEWDVEPTLTKSVKEVCEEDADAATDGAQVGVFTPAADNAATSLVQANAAFDQADDVVCSFAPDSANLNNFLYFSGSAALTADEKKGITDAIAKAKKAADDAAAAAAGSTTSADDTSSKSPAYALAAGAAAVFALLL